MVSKKKRIYTLIIKEYGDKKRLYQETCNLFNATFNPREPISKFTVVRTVQRFIETGNVKDRSTYICLQ